MKKYLIWSIAAIFTVCIGFVSAASAVDVEWTDFSSLPGYYSTSEVITLCDGKEVTISIVNNDTTNAKTIQLDGGTVGYPFFLEEHSVFENVNDIDYKRFRTRAASAEGNFNNAAPNAYTMTWNFSPALDHTNFFVVGQLLQGNVATITAYAPDNSVVNNDLAFEQLQAVKSTYTFYEPLSWTPGSGELKKSTTSGSNSRYGFFSIPYGTEVGKIVIVLADDGSRGSTADEVNYGIGCVSREEYSLCAGQTMEVGHMEVFNDDNNLYVKYVITEPGACLLETHLQAAADFTDIPQTKKGNPIPGQFAYSMEHSCVMAYTYPIPLDGLSGEIVIAAHAVVQMPSSGTTASCANEVFDFNQGLRKDGTAVLAARSIPENALGVPDSVRPLQSFYSLGFGGELSVTFPTFITGELTVSEVTWGSYPSETAEISVSRDGADWTVLGVADNSASGDIRPSSFTLNECYQYVKIVDTTDSSLFGSRPDADAFDVDAVCASTTCEEETAWGGCIDVDGFGFEGKNWATYFTYTVQ